MIPECKSCDGTPPNTHTDVNVRVIVGPVVAILAALVAIIAIGKLAPPEQPATAKPKRQVAKTLEITPVANVPENSNEVEKAKLRVRPLFPDEKGIRE